jgi:hypothetical protein
MNRIASDLQKIMSESDKKKTSGFDTQATVTRLDGDIAWVQFPGGEDETPVRRTTNAVVGDNVQVRVNGGRAWLLGNTTNPPTDDTVANVAMDNAKDANQNATAAWKTAEQALDSAGIANAAAAQAQRDAGIANTAANDSLSQLSIVEDVVGTLNCITTHATYKASADTEVHAGKWYFTKSGNTYNVVTNPTGNPSAKGYYEIDTIDEAVSNYVASHLALTGEGLYLTKDGNGYKILLANDGLRIFDPEGHRVSLFGESIILDASRPQRIGNDNVYIKYYDSNGDDVPDSLAIKANEFRLASGNTIQDEIGKIEGLNINMHVSGSNLVFTVALIQGGNDITDTVPDGDFEWFYRTPSGDVPMNLNGKTITIPQASQEYGRTVLCVWTRSEYANLLTNNGNKLRTSNGAYLIGRSEY